MTPEQTNFEQRKLLAAFLTALGVAAFAAGLFKPVADLLAGQVLAPYDTGRMLLSVGLMLTGIGLHLAGQAVLLGGDRSLWRLDSTVAKDAPIFNGDGE